MTVQFCPKISARSDKSFMINDLLMVEAAGVEPASEIAVSQESSCFVRFLFGFAPDAQNGQDAAEASPIDLAWAARTEPLLPAYCMTSAHSP